MQQTIFIEMIRVCVLIAFLQIFHQMAFSQANVTVGPAYEVVDGWKYYFAHNGEIMTVKGSNKKNTVVIQKFNAGTLKLLTARSYEDFPKDAWIETVKAFRDHYYVFYSVREGREEGLYVRKVDFATGTFTGEARRVIARKEKIDGAKSKLVFGFGAVTIDKYDFWFSYDSSRLIVQYRLMPQKKRDDKSHDVIGMHVFDPTMTEKWSELVTMPYTEKKMDILDYAVDAGGNVFISSQVFDDNSSKIKNVDGEPNYHIEIFRIEAGTGTVTVQEAGLSSKFISSVWLYETKQGDIIGAGLYNKGNYMNRTDGFVLFHFKNDATLADSRLYEIPLDILNQHTSARTKRRNERQEEDDKAEILNLIMREVLLQPDGGVILVAEQFFISTSSSTSRSTGAVSTQTFYHYSSILITRIDPAGRLVWMKRLPKKQYGGEDPGAMSYFYVNGIDKHHFLYLDTNKNLNLTVDQAPEGFASWLGGFLTDFQIDDKTGEVKKSLILDTHNIEGIELHQFTPRRMRVAGPGTVVFEAYKKKKEDVLVRIELE